MPRADFYLIQSPRFKQEPLRLVCELARKAHDAGLPLLFLEAFVLMGAFVTLFNYIGYRLLAAPYNLDQVFVGLLSVVYLRASTVRPKSVPWRTNWDGAKCCGRPSR